MVIVDFFFFTAKVGKTSLIMSLVSEEFPDEVQSFTEMTLQVDLMLVCAHMHCIISVSHARVVHLLKGSSQS